MTVKRIAITTGGGDAPGLNAVIRAVTLAAINRGWECVGIRSGFDGVLHPEKFPEGGLIPLVKSSVRGIAHTGGTILGTTNRGNPFKYEVKKPDGSVEVQDISGRLVKAFSDAKIDCPCRDRWRRHNGNRPSGVGTGNSSYWSPQDD